MKAQFSVTKGLLCRALGLRSWVWEELRLPLWLGVGGRPGEGHAGQVGAIRGVWIPSQPFQKGRLSSGGHFRSGGLK